MDIVNELQNNSKKFNKIIIWGLKKRWHTHRFIFQAYYKTLKKCGIPVIWVEDEKKNQKLIEKNDFIFSAGAYGKMVPEKKSIEDYNLPIRDDIYYCLHEEKDFFVDKINKNNRIILVCYHNNAENSEKIYEAVHFNKEDRIIYQPWGTDLLPNEFKKPVFVRNKFVFWVGSIWKSIKGEGNISEISKLKKALKNNKLILVPIRFIPNFLNRFLIRKSRLAPAIGGRIQVENNYLPCRMFKNISYGQLGFSNIEKFNDIFSGCNIYNHSIDNMIETVLDLSKEEYIKIIKKQQDICKKYTIANHLNNIFKYF